MSPCGAVDSVGTVTAVPMADFKLISGSFSNVYCDGDKFTPIVLEYVNATGYEIASGTLPSSLSITPQGTNRIVIGGTTPGVTTTDIQFQLLATGSLDQCGRAYVVAIKVNPNPVIALDASEVCAGDDIIVETTPGIASTIDWTVNGITTSQPASNDFVYSDTDFSSNTTVKISAVATTTANCKSSESITVPVYANPVLPTVTNYTKCEKIGTLDWSTLTKVKQGTLKWYSASSSADTDTISEPEIYDKSIAGSLTYYVGAMKVINSDLTCYSDKVPVTVTVNENPRITNIDKSDLTNLKLEVASDLDAQYSYQLSTGSSGEFINSTIAYLGQLSFGTHEVTVYALYDGNTCEATASFTIDAIPLEPEKYFTPNGDGINDTWDIGNLELYPNTEIYIHDRFGKEVAAYKGDAFRGWDGSYLGNPLPSTDYWYVIQVRETGKRLVGHFLLKR